MSAPAGDVEPSGRRSTLPPPRVTAPVVREESALVAAEVATVSSTLSSFLCGLVPEGGGVGAAVAFGLVLPPLVLVGWDDFFVGPSTAAAFPFSLSLFCLALSCRKCDA